MVYHYHSDSNDRITQFESHRYDPLGSKTSTHTVVYNSLDDLDDRQARLTEWQYDSMGNVIDCIEAKGTQEQKTTRYSYNRYGEKEKVELPNGLTLTLT